MLEKRHLSISEVTDCAKADQKLCGLRHLRAASSAFLSVMMGTNAGDLLNFRAWDLLDPLGGV